MSINDKQNMEQLILESATALFLEKGFKATSTTEIAKKAGCNQALVHYYYRTKDRLFDAIFEKKIKYFINNLVQFKSKDLTFKEKVRSMIESHFDAIKEEPKLPLFFFMEISANPQRIENLKDSFGNLPFINLAPMKAELEGEIAKGNIRKMTIYDLLISIVSLNITAFILEPMFKLITQISDEEYQALIKKRKEENLYIIMNSLKPN